MRYPCTYSDLRNSSWYDRLIAAEFDIRLDNYPEKATLIDRNLPEACYHDPRWTKYREVLLTLKDAPHKDEMTPYDFILRFRRARTEIFHEVSEPVLSTPSIVEDCSQNDLGILKRILDDHERLLLIPSSGDTAEHEYEFLNHLSPGSSVAMLVSGRSEYDLPKPGTFSEVSIDTLSDLEGIKELGSHIICLNPWLMFSLMSFTEDFTIMIDAGEWFVRGCFQLPGTGGTPILYPEGSGYGNILSPVEKKTGTTPLIGNLSHYQKVFGRHLIEQEYQSGGLDPDWLDKNLEDSGIEYVHGFANEGQDNWAFSDSPIPGGVQYSILIADEDRVDMKPVFPDRMVSPFEIRNTGIQFTSSFNYYVTDNLKNQYEKNHEALTDWRNFLLDYLYMKDDDNVFFESLPLYRKALLGCTPEGRLHGFYAEPETIQWGVDREQLRAVPINPCGTEDEALYLPGHGDSLVGHGRLCARVIHDQVVGILTGPVRIPPFGAILITEERLEVGQHLHWDVQWGSAPVGKTEWEWLFGGFNLLVSGGRNLHADHEMSMKTLRDEGWMDPVSMMTQETQLLPDVRQPRTVLGRTASGKIFLAVFSGRSALSSGMSFSELSSFCIQYCRDDNLDFLMNLDGGASAVLTVSCEDGQEVLSYPAPSDANPPGIPRPVPALLTITSKEKT